MKDGLHTGPQLGRLELSPTEVGLQILRGAGALFRRAWGKRGRGKREGGERGSSMVIVKRVGTVTALGHQYSFMCVCVCVCVCVGGGGAYIQPTYHN